MSQTDPPAFTQYIPGFEFLQNLGRQAAGSGGAAVPGMPPMSHWVAPTFDVEELDKRIRDLKAVHFWLDQNTKALAATIQALEVQKMTLATLQRMNVGLGEMAEAFKMRPMAESAVPTPAPTPPPAPAAQAPAPAPVAEPAAEAPAEATADEADAAQAPAAPAVDPMQWWGALTQQFQTIAASAMQDMAAQASRAAEQVAAQVQSATEAASDAAQSPATTAPSRRAKAAPKGASKPAAKVTPKAASKAAAAPRARKRGSA